jgi:hypothetical protein
MKPTNFTLGILLLISALASGCRERSYVFRASDHLEGVLKVGMSKSEVRVILGDPDNTDNSQIWMWGEEGISGNWRDMTSQQNCLFLVFDSVGKLKYDEFFSSNEAPPDEVIKRP